MSKLLKNLKRNLNFLNPFNPIDLLTFIFFIFVLFLLLALITIYMIATANQGQIFESGHFYSLTNILSTIKILLLIFIYIICAQHFTALKRPKLGIILALTGLLLYFLVYPIFNIVTYFYLPSIILLAMLLAPYKSKNERLEIRNLRLKNKSKRYKKNHPNH